MPNSVSSHNHYTNSYFLINPRSVYERGFLFSIVTHTVERLLKKYKLLNPPAFPLRISFAHYFQTQN